MCLEMKGHVLKWCHMRHCCSQSQCKLIVTAGVHNGGSRRAPRFRNDKTNGLVSKPRNHLDYKSLLILKLGQLLYWWDSYHWENKCEVVDQGSVALLNTDHLSTVKQVCKKAVVGHSSFDMTPVVGPVAVACFLCVHHTLPVAENKTKLLKRKQI